VESSNKYAMLQRACMDLMSSSTNEGNFVLPWLWTY